LSFKQIQNCLKNLKFLILRFNPFFLPFLLYRMSEPNLDPIVAFTGKLNRIEKQKTVEALKLGKSIGQILDDIAIHRDKIANEQKVQDRKNEAIKNPIEKINVKPKRTPLTPWEKEQRLRDQIRKKTDQLINLQNKKKPQLIPKDAN